MNNDMRMYGNTFNPNVIKDIKSLTEKIEKEENPEELMRLRMQRLYRGMEINSNIGRPWGGYYPY